MNPSAQQIMRALRFAAICALLALALMVWGVIAPHPITLVIAMSVGQALGTLSFVVFCVVVALDLRKSRVFDNAPPAPSAAPPDEPSS